MASGLASPTLPIPQPIQGLSVRIPSRARSSSLVKVEQVGDESQEDALDSAVYENVNVEWVNRKGMCFPEMISLTLRCPRGR